MVRTSAATPTTNASVQKAPAHQQQQQHAVRAKVPRSVSRARVACKHTCTAAVKAGYGGIAFDRCALHSHRHNKPSHTMILWRAPTAAALLPLLDSKLFAVNPVWIYPSKVSRWGLPSAAVLVEKREVV